MNKLFISLLLGLFLIGSLGLINASVFGDSLDGGLLAYYSCNQATGTTLINNITSAINGTFIGMTASHWVTGKIGNGIMFNSTVSEGINLTGITSTTGSYTFNYWIKNTGNTGPDNYVLDIETGRIVQGIDTNEFEATVTSSNKYGLLANDWNMVTLVMDGVNNVARVYINGTTNGTNISYSVDKNIGGQIALGNRYNIFGEIGANFIIDEFGIWSRVLTQVEITELYTRQQPTTFNVSLIYPANISQFHTNSSQYFNVSLSMSDSATDNVWKNNTYNIWYSNGTIFNITTVSGLTTNSTIVNKTFILRIGNYIWNSYACYGNTTFSNCLWGSSGNYTFGYNSSINSNTYEALDYETGNSTYALNITVPDGYTPSSAYLVYNGTSYSAAVTNTLGNFYTISKTLDISTSMLGNNTFYYKWNLSSSFSENTSTYNQTISPILFGLCNGTLTIPFLNFTFKDEATGGYIMASIPSSTFQYYLGGGSITKTFTFINNSGNLNYFFCGLPANRTYYIDAYMQYKNGTDYPQRIFDPDVISYTNTTTNTTLYLLSSTDGIYVTFQIVNTADQVISGVEVSATRTIDSTEVEVASGTTGADGTVTFWLNPDFSHDFVFSKSGYTTYETSLIPTQSSYTITLSSSASTVSDDYTKGMKLYIYPKSRELYNDTSYNFIFNLTSRSWELDSFGFSLRLANGTIVGSDSSTTEGSGASITYNTNNQTIIYIDYYWVVEGNYTNGTSYWIVTNSLNTGWSIKTFFTDLSLVLDSGLFGLDDFGRYLLSFLVLFMVVGVMGYKFGTTSPLFISITIFAVVFFLDVVTGLIPAIRGIDNVLTYLAGVILFVTIIAEVAR